MFSADDLMALIPGLALRRPVFHSEADFQHGLAWEAQTARPELAVQLESRPVRGMHVDLLFVDRMDGHRLAVELKYFTDRLGADVEGERFDLTHQSAHDVRSYDCVKDIARIEQMIAAHYAHSGVVLALSNDSWYWRAPSRTGITNAHAFRLHDGSVLSGSRAWGPKTGAGTKNGREAPLDLSGTYTLKWRDYSDLPVQRGLFRYLAVPVTNMLE